MSVDPRAYYFPKFDFKPRSIKETLRFNDPLTAIGSMILFVIWLAGTIIGGALYCVFFALQTIAWALGKIVSGLLSLSLGKVIAICIGIFIILLAI